MLGRRTKFKTTVKSESVQITLDDGTIIVIHRANRGRSCRKTTVKVNSHHRVAVTAIDGKDSGCS